MYHMGYHHYPTLQILRVIIWCLANTESHWSWGSFSALIVLSATVQSSIPEVRKAITGLKCCINNRAKVLAPFSAPNYVRRDGSNIQGRSTSFQVGEPWLPDLPCILCENVAVDSAPMALNSFTSMLQANSDISGWTVTMPSTAA